MKTLRALILAGTLGMSLVSALPALAQESPTQTWNSSEGFRDANNRAVDVATAEAQKRARSGGDGPGSSTVNYNGPVNDYTTQTINGNVSSSSATNAIAVTSNSSSLTANNGSNASVVYTTGAQSYNAQQGAASTVASTGTGNNTVAGTNTNHQ